MCLAIVHFDNRTTPLSLVNLWLCSDIEYVRCIHIRKLAVFNICDAKQGFAKFFFILFNSRKENGKHNIVFDNCISMWSCYMQPLSTHIWCSEYSRFNNEQSIDLMYISFVSNNLLNNWRNQCIEFSIACDCGLVNASCGPFHFDIFYLLTKCNWMFNNTDAGDRFEFNVFEQSEIRP